MDTKPALSNFFSLTYNRGALEPVSMAFLIPAHAALA